MTLQRVGRSIRFSETEWERVRSRARQAHMSASEYVRRRALEPADETPVIGTVPIALLRGVALDLRALAAAERARFAAADAADDWAHLLAIAERQIEAELL